MRLPVARRRQALVVVVGLATLALAVVVIASGQSTTKTHVAALGPASTATTPTTGASTTTAPDATATTAIAESSTDAPRTTAVPRETTPATEAPVTTAPEVPTRARGRVIDESGNPVAGMHVTLTTLSTGDTDMGRTDGDGSYDIACSPQPGVTFSLMLSSQGITNSPGESSLRYAYAFVGGSDDPTTAPPVQCMTSTEPAIVTVVHLGGNLTGHEFHSNGDPFPATSDGFRGMHVHRISCGAPCRNIDFIGRTVGNEYEVIGLAPGDYELRPDMEGPITVHIAAGETTVQDWTFPF